jgi:hypothetical protein
MKKKKPSMKNLIIALIALAIIISLLYYSNGIYNSGLISNVGLYTSEMPPPPP